MPKFTVQAAIYSHKHPYNGLTLTLSLQQGFFEVDQTGEMVEYHQANVINLKQELQRARLEAEQHQGIFIHFLNELTAYAKAKGVDTSNF